MKEAARGSRSRVSGRSTGNPRQQCRPTARQPDGQTATSRGRPTYKPREATTSSRAAATAVERSGELPNTRRKKRSTRPHRASYGGPRYGRRYCDATETPAVLASPKNAQPGKIFFGPFRFARAAERRERHAEPNQQQARRQQDHRGPVRHDAPPSATAHQGWRHRRSQGRQRQPL